MYLQEKEFLTMGQKFAIVAILFCTILVKSRRGLVKWEACRMSAGEEVTFGLGSQLKMSLKCLNVVLLC